MHSAQSSTVVSSIARCRPGDARVVDEYGQAAVVIAKVIEHTCYVPRNGDVGTRCGRRGISSKKFLDTVTGRVEHMYPSAGTEERRGN